MYLIMYALQFLHFSASQGCFYQTTIFMNKKLDWQQLLYKSDEFCIDASLLFLSLYITQILSSVLSYELILNTLYSYIPLT